MDNNETSLKNTHIVSNLTDFILDLISFESDNINGENDVMLYIETYLKKKYGNSLNYIKQNIGDRTRYNLLVTNTDFPDIILGGHLDIVPVSTKEQLKGKIIGNRLYGRGSVDMKSGVVINISLIEELLKNNCKFWILFYCDEEYNFLGMEKFVEQYSGLIKPKLTIITEPTDERIILGYRGVAEFVLKLKGKSSHAARKQAGINAINEFYNFVLELESFFKKKDDSGFHSSINIGGISGGLDNNGTLRWKGNSLADTAEGLLEIRIGNNTSQEEFETFMYEYLSTKRVEIDRYKMNFWLGPLLQKHLIEKYSQYGEAVISDVFGYSDIQMIKESIGGECILIGPKPNDKSHQSDEYVDIDSIFKVRDNILKIISDL